MLQWEKKTLFQSQHKFPFEEFQCVMISVLKYCDHKKLKVCSTGILHKIIKYKQPLFVILLELFQICYIGLDQL